MEKTLEMMLTGIWSFLDKPILVIAALVFLIIVAFIDSQTMKIPNKVNLIAFLTAIGLTSVYGITLKSLPLNLSMSLIGTVVGFLIIFIPAFIMNVPMGGDIKCYAVMGSFLGPYGVMGFACISCITVLVGKVLRVAFMKGNIFYKQLQLKEKFPMGPWLLFSYLITCAVGVVVPFIK